MIWLNNASISEHDCIAAGEAGSACGGLMCLTKSGTFRIILRYAAWFHIPIAV